MLSRVVGSCCTKFETSQTFSYVQTDAATPNELLCPFAGSVKALFMVCTLTLCVLFEPKIQDAVSDPNIGRMRLQFWRDSLDNIYQVK